MISVKVLYLEDDPDDVHIVETFLNKSKKFKYEIRTTDQRETYIKQLMKFNPEVVLADYRLPAFSGLEAMEICRHHNPGIVFIFVTGVIGDELAVETILSGAWDIVLKSNLSRLNEVVEACLWKTVGNPYVENSLYESSYSKQLQRQIEINQVVLSSSKNALEVKNSENFLYEVMKKELERKRQVLFKLREQLGDA